MSIQPMLRSELKISEAGSFEGTIGEVQVSGVIEISFNYFLLGGETQEKARPIQ